MTKGKKTRVNRQYKDSLFRMIFSEKEELLSLYNAINGTDYTDTDKLTINTIEDVIFLGYKNDLSLVLEQRLGIYEHQSTWCGNIPLRNLIYVGRNYAGITASEKLYSSKKIEIPNPHFVVFYNGKAKRPEREIVKLSDAYIHQEEDPKLELEVVVLNINTGYNQELMDKCKKLKEYSIFVSTVREYREAKKINIEEAIAMAVEKCIETDVLKEFLLKHREEVQTVSLGEYNFQEHMELVAKESREDALAEGVEIGMKCGIEQGIEQGIQMQRIKGEEQLNQERINSEKKLTQEREENEKKLTQEREENEKKLAQQQVESARVMKDMLTEMGLDMEAVKTAMRKAINISDAELEKIMAD